MSVMSRTCSSYRRFFVSTKGEPEPLTARPLPAQESDDPCRSSRGLNQRGHHHEPLTPTLARDGREVVVRAALLASQPGVRCVADGFMAAEAELVILVREHPALVFEARRVPATEPAHPAS